MVSFTLRPPYPRYPLCRRLGGPQSRSGRRGKVKLLNPIGTRNPTSRSSVRYNDYVIPAPQQKRVPGILLGVKGGRAARNADVTASVARLSRKCGILDVLRFCGPPRPVTRIALLTLLPGYTASRCTVITVMVTAAYPEVWGDIPGSRHCQFLWGVIKFPANQPSHYSQHGPSWEADSRSSDQQINWICFHTAVGMFTKASLFYSISAPYSSPICWWIHQTKVLDDSKLLSVLYKEQSACYCRHELYQGWKIVGN
jgi:hypothetical protein